MPEVLLFRGLKGTGKALQDDYCKSYHDPVLRSVGFSSTNVLTDLCVCFLVMMDFFRRLICAAEPWL